MKSVLITGGSGYFGQGMVRYLIERTAVDRICVFSRGEYAQAKMRQAIDDKDARLHWFVGDVRDGQRLRRAMLGCDTVIHAAALKRVEVGEYNPGEMVKTNVLGTMNVIEAAQDASVARVVYLSSDKACEPLNCYGATKLAAEKLVLAANNARGSRGPVFVVTRYGNVAGSTGSVIPTWRQHITEGRAIFVSNPEATRFWMTIEQAVALVYEAAESANADTERPIVPDLPAYDLQSLITAMEINPRHVYQTELGKGEKLHERMREGGPDSSQVRRMAINELREALQHV